MNIHPIAKLDTVKKTKSQLKQLCKAVQKATQHQFRFTLTTSQNALASAYGFTSWSDLMIQAKSNENAGVFNLLDDISTTAMHSVFTSHFVDVAEAERKGIIGRKDLGTVSFDLQEFTILWKDHNKGEISSRKGVDMPLHGKITVTGRKLDVGDNVIVYHGNTKYTYTVEAVNLDVVSIIAGVHVVTDNGLFSTGGFETPVKGELLRVEIAESGEGSLVVDAIGTYDVRVDADVKPYERASAALDCIASNIAIGDLEAVDIAVYDAKGVRLFESERAEPYAYTGRAVVV